MNKPVEAIEPVIQIKGLSKTYPGSSRPALHNLNISIKAGEVYGFLGPNGAGKSTTIRLLMNFLKPSAGTASIRGYDIVNDSLAIRRSIGYLSGDFAMYPKMTGRQFLQYMNDLRTTSDMAGAVKLAARLGADLDKRLGELSRGNRQKIGIIQAFMSNPQILILDEPTSGLDPLVQETFYALIHEAKQRGASIFMSSHILSEVQKMCDRVGIIKEGQLISEKNIAEMAAEATTTFEIEFNGQAPIDLIRGIKGVKIKSHIGNTVVIHVSGKLSALFAVLAKYDVKKLDVHSLDLEESFIHFYENKEEQ